LPRDDYDGYLGLLGIMRASFPRLSQWAFAVGGRLGDAVRNFAVVSALFFAALALGLCARVLFNNNDFVWSKAGNDLTTAFVPWWTFGYDQMCHGNFPLWNPHNFCGTPFFSNFNSGMLYPLHLIALLLPLQTAINIFLPVNIAISGWSTSLWCRHRGVSPTGSVLAGVIYMFSGAYFHHTYAGHEPVMTAMSLAPLIFLCVDAIFDEASWRWVLLGALVVGLQCLTAYPQAIYYTGLMSGLYLLLRLVLHEGRLRVCGRFLLLYAGGAMLGAVQLLPGLQTTGESVRQGGNNIEFASISPMPPENLAQLIAPGLFGDVENSPYIGRWFPWEVSLFCGVSTLILAGYGALYGNREQRQFAITLLIVSTVLALGVNVRPVYRFLYDYLPLFGTFRVTARFNWFMTLYIAMLAGIGFDVLTGEEARRHRAVLVASIGAAILAVLALLWVNSAKAGLDGAWGHFVRKTQADHQTLQVPVGPVVDGLVLQTGTFAATRIGFSALTLAIMAGALGLLRFSPRFRYLVAGVTIVEMLIFADATLATGPIHLPYPSDWLEATRADEGDLRVLHTTLEFPNTALLYNYNDGYGYDPVTLKRYADLLAMTQDLDPDKTNFVTQIFQNRYPKLFEMLRCHYIFFMQQVQAGDGSTQRTPRAIVLPDPMPQLQLIQQYEVDPSRAEVFAALRSPTFNPRAKVILESPPDPAPTGTPKDPAPGWASVVRQSTDWIEIKADLREPAILLITDAYSKSWRAVPLDVGPQPHYDLMPANYALRAIPLAAGKHHLLLVYAPIGFKIGVWISIASAIMWLALGGWHLFLERKSSVAPVSGIEAVATLN
jgi:hypothetical protein